MFYSRCFRLSEDFPLRKKAFCWTSLGFDYCSGSRKFSIEKHSPKFCCFLNTLTTCNGISLFLLLGTVECEAISMKKRGKIRSMNGLSLSLPYFLVPSSIPDYLCRGETKTWRLAGMQVRMNEILESLNPLLTMREKQQRQEEAESSSELWTSLSSFPCCFTLCSLGKIEQIFNISLILKPLSFLFSLRLFFSSPQLRLRNLFYRWN